jgi:hypothetical protein
MNISVGPGVAVPGFPLKGGLADYLLDADSLRGRAEPLAHGRRRGARGPAEVSDHAEGAFAMKMRIRLGEVSPTAGRRWDLDHIFHVGHLDGLEVRFLHPSVSRYHALIRPGRRTWLIRDLNSAAGTFVNGARLFGEYRPLWASDRIEFGKAVVEVESTILIPDPSGADWESCDDPVKMINFWADVPTARRKLRLFAVACYRRMWAQLNGASRLVVEEAERIAEEDRDLADLGLAPEAAAAPGRVGRTGPLNALSDIDFQAGLEPLRRRRAGGPPSTPTLRDITCDGVQEMARLIRRSFLGEENDPSELAEEDDPRRLEALLDSGLVLGEQTLPTAAEEARRSELADLVRCLFPNPFRPAPVADPCWLAWEGGTVVRLAEGIHPGASDQMPVLADALEEAGCADHGILTHLRGPGPHVRGCHVVDLILGKA